ncbi:MAG: phosphotransferase [Actinobacteria bacterium]|nr:phosphotransferase [Actinomycetota bacterium]
MTRLHDDEVEIDETIASRLIGAQFPELADRPLRIVEPWGTANAVWRLGDDLVARFPRYPGSAAQPGRDHRVLPLLAAHLSVPIPSAVAVGRPGAGYPFEWSIHRWIDGVPAESLPMADPSAFALDLALALGDLHEIPIDDAPAARNRARPLADYDDETRGWIDGAAAVVDAEAALAVWDDALAAPAQDVPPVWVHGDLEGNCLTSDGRLCGLVDWGSACAGDPAVDVQVIWSPLFTDRSRTVFLDALQVDDATVRRAKGAAIHQACAALAYYLDTYQPIVDRSRHKLLALGVPVRA